MINAALANIPLCTGFSYARWKKGLNVMIEKTSGDFNIKKLRIILLFKVDFNANNKWICQALMYRVEQAHLLADEQFSSHKFKSAIYQCLNKQLFYNLIHFSWQLAALCSNDAKSCYDQITLLAATLCLCRLGGTQPMVSSMISTIHEMEHHIYTTFGDSTISASHQTWKEPIAGIGQGNGAGPQIWAAVSSPILNIMQLERFYMHLITIYKRGKGGLQRLVIWKSGKNSCTSYVIPGSKKKKTKIFLLETICTWVMPMQQNLPGF